MEVVNLEDGMVVVEISMVESLQSGAHHGAKDGEAV
jgi:hypothetical protein